MTDSISSSMPDVTGSSVPNVHERLSIIETSLQRIESLLHGQETNAKEWYDTAEAAAILGKAVFTVREWCRLGRVNAHKRPSGRGRSQEWILSRTEIERIQNKGLLPIDL